MNRYGRPADHAAIALIILGVLIAAFSLPSNLMWYFVGTGCVVAGSAILFLHRRR